MAVFSGALAPKKKQDLQELATELGIDSTGTKDDLQERIKTHLAANPSLSKDDRFAGLFARRKSARQAARDSSQQPPEASPSVDENSVGTVTRRTASKVFNAIPDAHEVKEAIVAPSSPARSVIAAFNRAVAAAPEPEAVMQIVEERSRKFYIEVDKTLNQTRALLSNAKNISSITVLAEFLFIIYTVVPWAFYAIPLNAPYTTHYNKPVQHGQLEHLSPESTRVAYIPYPPQHFLKDHSNYTTLLMWSIPTVIIPQLVGILISFRPGAGWANSKEADPLTAAIIRIACVIAGDWALDWSSLGISSKWRLLGASVAGAFALAEAIGERKNRALAIAATEAEDEAEEDEEPQSNALTRRSTRHT